jgi:copper chaperone CopZ
VSVALKNINGVDSVNVSLNKGFADVTLKPGNNVTIEQLQHAITKNGFKPKQSTVTVSGTLLSDAGKLKLRVSGSNETFGLVPGAQLVRPSDLKQLIGKTVTLEGFIPEVQKDKKADTIEFRSITGT